MTMKIKEIKDILEAEVLCGEKLMEYEVKNVFASDLMSDVLAFARNKTLLLTGLTNSQVVRTAEMIDLGAIIFVRGKRPEEETVELACENNIILMVTRDTMYAASGKLYGRGLPGISL